MINIADQMPGDAAWPRFMSGPHPLAVATLLPELEAWLPTITPSPLRWWQRLVLSRLLEVDSAGDLVWRQAIFSTARQSGKSWALRALVMWLITQEARWHDIRDCLYISKDVASAMEVMRPAMLWVKRRTGGSTGPRPGDWWCREANGQFEVIYDYNRWMVRSRDSAYGYTAAEVVADEAWRLEPAIIEEGVEPTMVERASSQLLLVSTAHRRATSLVRTRRAQAIRQIDAPGSALILEWSSPPDLDLDDELGWRMASPHWSERRRELIATRVEAAMRGEGGDADEPDPREYVAAQWLNRWPDAPQPRLPGMALLETAEWAPLRSPGLHLPSDALPVAAMEAMVGHQPAVAVAWRQPDSRIAVVGQLIPTLDSAWAWLGTLPPGTTFLVGLSWRNDPRARALGAQGVGQRETEQALPVLADTARAAAIEWDGDQLGDQMLALRVVDSSSGSGKSVLRSGAPTHLARAAAWAVWHQATAIQASAAIW